jgi:hypothetical protein
MSQPPKRRYPRVAVDLPTELSVLIPEETFQPVIHKATVTDLSERGAMVQVELKEDIYRTLLQKTRYCRLTFLNVPSLPDKIIGKAVWIQPEGSISHTKYKIGLFFEELPEKIAEQLRTYVDTVAATQGILPETP